MKYILILFVFISSYIFPQQIDFRGSMGINFVSSPSLRDYLNQNYRTGAELGTFNSAVNFSVESDFYISNNFAVGVEAAYELNSFSFSSDIGKRELSAVILMPSFTAYYVLSGLGYNFKFGGGVGPRFGLVNETFTLYSEDHNTVGLGFLLKADGNTLLGGNLFANIGADLRYDIPGSFTAGRSSGIEVDLDSFSAGVRLGLTYIIF